MVLRISPCAIDDGPRAATIHTSTVTPFLEHQYRSIEAARDILLRQYSAILGFIEHGELDEAYLKVVDEDTGTMIAWAIWELPSAGTKSKQNLAIPTPKPWEINSYFCHMASHAIRQLRERVLKGRKSYLLDQLATLPAHQRRGAGTMLLTWPFERADKEGLVCYLDTEADGKVMALYEKVGYVKVDQCEVSLAYCGLEDKNYTHVAMIREPVSASKVIASDDVSLKAAATGYIGDTVVCEQGAN